MKIKFSNVKKVYIKSDFIKLDALLKLINIASTGGEAKYYIQNGDVYVGGTVTTQRGKKIRPGDTVRFNDTVYLILAANGS